MVAILAIDPQEIAFAGQVGDVDRLLVLEPMAHWKGDDIPLAIKRPNREPVIERLGLRHDRDIELAPVEHRRNLTTRDVPLNHLVGRYFSVGSCVLYGGRLNAPCAYLETVTGKKVMAPLLNRSGLNCRIVVGGVVRVGDRVEPCDPGTLDPEVRRANDAIPPGSTP